MPFTEEAFGDDSVRILDTITQVEAHSYHGPSYQNAKKGWAISGMCVVNFIYLYHDINIIIYIFVVLRCLIPVPVHRPSITTLRWYWIEIEELWYYGERTVFEL